MLAECQGNEEIDFRAETEKVWENLKKVEKTLSTLEKKRIEFQEMIVRFDWLNEKEKDFLRNFKF